MNAVGLDDHGHGIPADDAFDPPFDLAVAGIGGFSFRRNGIDIRRVDRSIQIIFLK